MRGRRDSGRYRPRRIDVLEDRGEQLLSESRAVRVVGRLALAAARDPVGNFLEDDGVADQQLHHVRLVGRHAHGDPDQVALAFQRRPAPFPRHVIAPRPRLAHGSVARDGHVLAALVAPAHELGHVLVDVFCDQRGAYNKPAAEDAWGRVKKLFAEELK